METPGTILIREREARGLTLRDISCITRIPVPSLQHLEDDRFELLPAEVFAKGFLRCYAREVEVSNDEIILAYNNFKGQRRGGFENPEPFGAKPEFSSLSSVSIPQVDNASNKKDSGSSRKVNPFKPFGASLSPGKPKGSGSPFSRSHMDTQRTSRVAYLVIFLVVAASLGLSVLFAGTGEAEENQRRVRPIAESESQKDRWMMRDEGLDQPSISEGSRLDTAFESGDFPATQTPVPGPAPVLAPVMADTAPVVVP